MFLVCCLETTVCLPDIYLVACIACDLVYPAFFILRDEGTFFLVNVLLCRCSDLNTMFTLVSLSKLVIVLIFGL